MGIIRRYPVVDPNQKVIGYILTCPGAPDSGACLIMNELLAGAQDRWPYGDKMMFIPVSLEGLASPQLGRLPQNRVVLMFNRTQLQDPGMQEGLRQVRTHGFHVALNDYDPDHPNTDVIMKLNYVGMDVQQLGLPKTLAAAKSLNLPSVRLLALNLTRPEEFKQCRGAGMGRMQGTWFMHVDLGQGKQISPAQALVVQLLEKVKQDASEAEIEDIFKRDASLSFKLLRYINSAGFGLLYEVDSIRHAIRVLGRNELYRWITVLLFSAGAATPPVLTRAAVTRGRFMELVGQSTLSPDERTGLFITGSFSLLDKILEMPMPQALEQIHLPENITDALLHNVGIFAPFLELARICDAQDPVNEPGAMTLGLSEEWINRKHLEALQWVENLGI